MATYKILKVGGESGGIEDQKCDCKFYPCSHLYEDGVKDQKVNVWEDELYFGHLEDILFLQKMMPYHKNPKEGMDEIRDRIEKLKQWIKTNFIAKSELKKIASDVTEIIVDSKPTFFVKDKAVKILAKDLLYEQKAEICTNVEMYFIKKLDSLE